MKNYNATWENSSATFRAANLKGAKALASMHKRQARGEIKGKTSVRLAK